MLHPMWGLIFFASAMLTFIVSWGSRVSRQRYFEHRIPRSHDEFAREEFPKCPEVASAIRGLLDKWMAELALRTEVGDLLCHHYILDDDIELSEFVDDVEEQFAVSFDSIEAEEVETLGDVIRFVAASKK